jgi:hypothetical protein
MAENLLLAPPRPANLFSRPLQRVALLVAILIPLTSSFDIFLIINAGGNFRFCQIIGLVLGGLAILKVSRRKPLGVLGLSPLLVWFLVQCAFIPVGSFWPKSVAYCLWLAFNIGLMFSYVQLFTGDAFALLTLLRWYVYSFAIVAGFGILQFALPLVGLPGIFVVQWWIPGILPRANAFSYEPSYFATYLLIGFVFVSTLWNAGSPLLPRKVLRAIYWLLALGIVLSSSRMGMLFLMLEIVLSQSRAWLNVMGDLVRRRISRANVRALAPSMFAFSLMSVVGFVGVAALQQNPAMLLMFLNGTGISDTAAHSVLQREGAFEETLQVFAQHPFIGQSLGGVSSAIAELNGESVHSFEESKAFEGMSVFAEALTASGVFGFIPFVYFVVVTARQPLRLADRSSYFNAVILRGLVRSLIFAWAILQVNQNILRPYLWVHLALLATVYASARRADVSVDRRSPRVWGTAALAKS